MALQYRYHRKADAPAPLPRGSYEVDYLGFTKWLDNTAPYISIVMGPHCLYDSTEVREKPAFEPGYYRHRDRTEVVFWADSLDDLYHSLEDYEAVNVTLKEDS